MKVAKSDPGNYGNTSIAWESCLLERIHNQVGLMYFGLC